MEAEAVVTYGTFGPAHARLGRLIYGLARRWYRWKYARHQIWESDSRFANERIAALKFRLARGETVHLAGVGVAGHNSGAALVEVSAKHGIKLISNDEEERFTAIKHCDLYPIHSLDVLTRRLSNIGKTPADLHAVLLSWDYAAITCLGYQTVAEHFPGSLALIKDGASTGWDFFHNGKAARRAPRRMGEQFGLPGPQPLIQMPHHENHAAFSFAMSPFNGCASPVMITVLDGCGDDGAISLYVAEQGVLRRLRHNQSLSDSLGAFYSIISSTQGGWTVLSSEGRYMGAVAWGDRDRLTNPFYRQLRQIFHFGPDGHVHVNRSLANWHRGGECDAYSQALRQAIGDPIPAKKMWNPDAVLRVEELEHADVTTRRVDLAAATQLVFEDVLFHIVDYLIRSTGSDRLVLTGGTALNCLANMHLLERYDQDWYRRNLGKKSRLHLWAPPTPGDAGVAMGAAYAFALRAGVRPGAPLQHAFYCGIAPDETEIHRALESHPDICCHPLGNLSERLTLEHVADSMARVVAADGVVGLYQGAAETGPRALGHRSILANPCNPHTLQTINRRVKYREPIRPLAPMLTLAAAKRYFKLSPGAADDEFNAYNYMVLAAHALPEAYERIPAVVHKDGTSRLQIVRQSHDSLAYAYLKAMGRRLGVEVSVNTSLNVGSPIVQSPDQALGALRRAQALSGLVMVADTGEAWFVWHSRSECPRAFSADSNQVFDGIHLERGTTSGSPGSALRTSSVNTPPRATSS
jgi:carbamoyltransferase